MEESKIPKWATKVIFFALMAYNFVGFASYSVIAPFFPTQAQRKGVSQTETGLIFSCFALLVIICSPTCGHFISRSGPKRFLVMAGIVCGSANVVFGLLNNINDTVLFTVACFFVRICEAVGFAALNTATFATVGRLYSANLGSAMGLVEISIGSGMGLGPAIGSALFSVGGYPLPFVVLGTLLVCLAVNIYMLISCIPGADRDLFQEVKSEHQGMTVWKFLKIGSAQLTLLLVVGCVFGLTSVVPTLALHLKEQLDVNETGSGYYFSCQCIANAIAALVAGWLSDRSTSKFRPLIMVCGLVVNACGLLLVGPSPIFGRIGFEVFGYGTVATNYAGCALLGVGSALVIVLSFQVLIDSAKESTDYDEKSTHGIVGGTLNGFYNLGAMVGPAVGAYLTEHFSFRFATTAIGAGQLILALVAALLIASRSFFKTRNNRGGHSAFDSVGFGKTEKAPLQSAWK